MYKCKVCGRIITDEEYTDEQECGSGGYCYCQFSSDFRFLNDMVEVEWWEMLNWNTMANTWVRLSDEIKNKIRGAGLAPDYDEVQGSSGSET